MIFFERTKKTFFFLCVFVLNSAQCCCCIVFFTAAKTTRSIVSFTSALFSPTPKTQNYKKKEEGKTRTRALVSPSFFALFQTKQCDSPSLSSLRSASRSHPWYVFLHALAAIEKLNKGTPHALALWNCKDDGQLRLTPGAPGAHLPDHFAADSGVILLFVRSSRLGSHDKAGRGCFRPPRAREKKRNSNRLCSAEEKKQLSTHSTSHSPSRSRHNYSLSPFLPHRNHVL